MEGLRATAAGLLCMALVVGVGAGLGAAAFRYLIYGFTWLFTGYQTFGHQGHASSLHLHWLGPWFVIVAPVLGGLVIGPLIHVFAREARGHGVPEVMVAVAENGGRIRPQVTVVKAIASALCIGSGGSVGREGPIVQIGSALASTFGQVVRMSESRLRILVACGAAGGISATFNAPLTGVFFGLELILREVSLEAFIATLTASVTADVISQSFFGFHPFFTGLPPVRLPNAGDYVLCGVLGLLGGAVGVGFKGVLYRIEDVCDALWRGRPEWLRPAVGGVVLGLLLLAVPQMYGVGYPVMQRVIAGSYVLWFVLLLVAAKMVATSLTIGIGGSGGVFAPSLFMGACLGTAYGLTVQHVFGVGVGPVPAYAMIAMGAVFAGAARAPLTSTTSVLEMTGDFSLVLPVMLGTALASALSARLSRGTIYTTKLLRRGTDIERTTPANLMQAVTVADTMLPLPKALARVEMLHPLRSRLAQLAGRDGPGVEHEGSATEAPGEQPYYLFENETLEQALRQLVLYGHQGLPVVAEDGATIVGWITNRDVLYAFARQLGQSVQDTGRGARAAQFVEPYLGPRPEDGQGSRPARSGYQLTSLDVPDWRRRPVRIGELPWPADCLVVILQRDGETLTPDAGTELRAGDRLVVLASAADTRWLSLVRSALSDPVGTPGDDREARRRSQGPRAREED